MQKSLADWLLYIESLHPKAIAMGLDRAQQLIDYLPLKPTFKIVTVGGTNGKGSTCAMLATIYAAAGYRVGCYTSPHLINYNERVTVNLKQASDEALCDAFETIEEARQALKLQLTYFEVGTLAAMWHFIQSNVDIAILEIGLGGRLDTVNAFDADCAIVTSIDLDHQEFLGDTREKIGAEKAAIYRPHVPAICGDESPPASLLAYVKMIQAQGFFINADFNCVLKTTLTEMQFSSQSTSLALPVPALYGAYQLRNAACALMAVSVLQNVLPVPEDAIASAMRDVKLAGRFQIIRQAPDVILDVAHNPHAAGALADNLRALSNDKTIYLAVFAMLADKDVSGVVEALAPLMHEWYIAGIHHARGALGNDLHACVSRVNTKAHAQVFDAIDSAYHAAFSRAEKYMIAGENVKIIVFGSFYTVASVLQLERERAPA